MYDAAELDDVLDLLWSSKDFTPSLLTELARGWSVMRPMMTQKRLEPWFQQEMEQSIRRIFPAATFSPNRAWAFLITVINAAYYYYERHLPIDSFSAARSYERSEAGPASFAQLGTTGVSPALLERAPPASPAAQSVADLPKGAAPPAACPRPIPLPNSSSGGGVVFPPINKRRRKGPLKQDRTWRRHLRLARIATERCECRSGNWPPARSVQAALTKEEGVETSHGTIGSMLVVWRVGKGLLEKKLTFEDLVDLALENGASDAECARLWVLDLVTRAGQDESLVSRVPVRAENGGCISSHDSKDTWLSTMNEFHEKAAENGAALPAGSADGSFPSFIVLFLCRRCLVPCSFAAERLAGLLPVACSSRAALCGPTKRERWYALSIKHRCLSSYKMMGHDIGNSDQVFFPYPRPEL